MKQMNDCKKCGWSMKGGDILIIRPDNMLLCPECEAPIEFIDKRVEEPNKDKASEAIESIKRMVGKWNTEGSSYSSSIVITLKEVEQELKAKDKEIELIIEDRDDILAIMESQRKSMRDKDKEIADNRTKLIAKNQEITDLLNTIDANYDELEELADLVVKWEAGYAELFKKITEIKESGAMA